MKNKKKLENNYFIKSINYIPFPGMIMVRPDELPTESKGILLTPESQERTYYGVVTAIGPERKDEPYFCKVGDHVMYNKITMNEVKIDGQKYQFFRTNEILAIVEGKE